MSLLEREAKKKYGITPSELRAFAPHTDSREADAILSGNLGGLKRKTVSHKEELPLSAATFAGHVIPGYTLTYLLCRNCKPLTRKLWYGFDTALGLADAGLGHYSRMTNNRLYNSAYDKVKRSGAGLVKESGLIKGAAGGVAVAQPPRTMTAVRGNNGIAVPRGVQRPQAGGIATPDADIRGMNRRQLRSTLLNETGEDIRDNAALIQAAARG